MRECGSRKHDFNRGVALDVTKKWSDVIGFMTAREDLKNREDWSGKVSE